MSMPPDSRQNSPGFVDLTAIEEEAPKASTDNEPAVGKNVLLEENHSLRQKLVESEARNAKLEEELANTKEELRYALEAVGALVVSGRGDTISKLLGDRASSSQSTSRGLKRPRSPSVEVLPKPPTRNGAKSPSKQEASRVPNDTTQTKESVDKASVQTKPEVTGTKIQGESSASHAQKRQRVDNEPIKVDKSKTDSTASSEPQAKNRSIGEVKRLDINLKDVMVLPPDVTEVHLAGASRFKIEPPPMDLEVSRDFLRVSYGGNHQAFLVHIKAERNPSGSNVRHCVFPMLDLNPAMPSAPGEPGLIFASRHEILENGPWTLFVKKNAKVAIWLYLGEYNCVLCGKLTPEQFLAQSRKVQNEWAQALLDALTYDVYVSMRVRIALRKAGIIPVDDKEKEEALIKEEILAVKRKRPQYKVTSEDIIEGFTRGDEAVDIIRLTCVKYDHVFANDIKRKYEESVASSSRKSKGKKKQTRPRGTQRASKNLLSPIPGDSEDAANDASEAGSAEEFNAPSLAGDESTTRVSARRGTRIRRSVPALLLDATTDEGDP